MSAEAADRGAATSSRPCTPPQTVRFLLQESLLELTCASPARVARPRRPEDCPRGSAPAPSSAATQRPGRVAGLPGPSCGAARSLTGHQAPARGAIREGLRKAGNRGPPRPPPFRVCRLVRLSGDRSNSGWGLSPPLGSWAGVRSAETPAVQRLVLTLNNYVVPILTVLFLNERILLTQLFKVGL